MKLEDPILIKRILEAAIMAADKPLPKKDIKQLFDELECPDDQLIDEALEALTADCEKRGYELVKVASGYRFQVKQELSRWVSKLWKEKAPRYSRALLETLALIAYRQPITRGEIENIRGVAVSSQIIRTLLERDWIKAVGHRDVPGRPAIYATTKIFLDYFNLKSLDQLPPLAEVRDINAISQEFDIEIPPEMQEVVAEEESAEGEGAEGESTARENIEGETAETGDMENDADVEAEPVAAESVEDDSEEVSVHAEDDAEQSETFGDLEVISADLSEEAEQESVEIASAETATQLTDSDIEEQESALPDQARYELMASGGHDRKTPLDC